MDIDAISELIESPHMFLPVVAVVFILLIVFCCSIRSSQVPPADYLEKIRSISESQQKKDVKKRITKDISGAKQRVQSSPKTTAGSAEIVLTNKKAETFSEKPDRSNDLKQRKAAKTKKQETDETKSKDEAGTGGEGWVVAVNKRQSRQQPKPQQKYSSGIDEVVADYVSKVTSPPPKSPVRRGEAPGNAGPKSGKHKKEEAKKNNQEAEILLSGGDTAQGQKYDMAEATALPGGDNDGFEMTKTKKSKQKKNKSHDVNLQAVDALSHVSREEKPNLDSEPVSRTASSKTTETSDSSLQALSSVCTGDSETTTSSKRDNKNKKKNNNNKHNTNNSSGSSDIADYEILDMPSSGSSSYDELSGVEAAAKASKAHRSSQKQSQDSNNASGAPQQEQQFHQLPPSSARPKPALEDIPETGTAPLAGSSSKRQKSSDDAEDGNDEEENVDPNDEEELDDDDAGDGSGGEKKRKKKKKKKKAKSNGGAASAEVVAEHDTTLDDDLDELDTDTLPSPDSTGDSPQKRRRKARRDN